MNNRVDLRERRREKPACIMSPSLVGEFSITRATW